MAIRYPMIRLWRSKKKYLQHSREVTLDLIFLDEIHKEHKWISGSKRILDLLANLSEGEQVILECIENRHEIPQVAAASSDIGATHRVRVDNIATQVSDQPGQIGGARYRE